MKISFDLNPEMTERYDSLKRRLGIDSDAQLASTAISLLEWAVTEITAGRDILSRDWTDRTDTRLDFEPLERARPATAPKHIPAAFVHDADKDDSPTIG